MKDFLKQNIAIVLAFVLPLTLIVVVALSTYLPSRSLTTNYNFVYALCSGQNAYPCTESLPLKYTVESGKLIVSTSTSKDLDVGKNGIPDVRQYPARLFLHDTKTNTNREITEDEGRGLTLNNLLTSPDGIIISGHYNNSGNVFPFGGSSEYNYFMSKGNASRKLNLITTGDLYYNQNNFAFIGWVMPGRN